MRVVLLIFSLIIFLFLFLLFLLLIFANFGLCVSGNSMMPVRETRRTSIRSILSTIIPQTRCPKSGQYPISSQQFLTQVVCDTSGSRLFGKCLASSGWMTVGRVGIRERRWARSR